MVNIRNAFANTTVATFVVLKTGPNNVLVPVKKIKSTFGDLIKHFPMKDGDYVVGPNIAREFTFKEMVAKGIAPDVNTARKMRDNPAQYHLTLDLMVPAVTVAA